MKPEIDLWALENELYDSGISTLCGVDEAGRGPLAGPVCAAAVILPRGLVIPGLDDSKKLSEKRREALYDEITQKALHWHAAFASEPRHSGPRRRAGARAHRRQPRRGCGA